MKAQEILDEVYVSILESTDWNEFRWMELKNKVDEDEKAEQYAVEDLEEEEDIRSYENANNT